MNNTQHGRRGSRGINFGSIIILSLGAYETLQGSGALRSTLNDISKYRLAALYVDAGMPTPIDGKSMADCLPLRMQL